MLPMNLAKQTQEAFNVLRGTAGVAAAVLTANPWEAFYGVYIRNHHATDDLVVGGADVTAGTGFAIAAGDSLWIPIDDATKIYAIRGAAADVAYSALVI